ncbi:hypothetical protein [Ktedonobacter racemifer]|uniref:Uncharacterized protein n=1 Tax=Ktedonobacter racemifer DSM 44963 TaxID=485913 RepID=D6TXD9_KTERA|nr:hypothetical protein [Ktedonobacter racemifer]EFH84872.1 hypothetical protein Krac_5987 [Ktedonobacter racemifer DSM 44963]
MNGKDFEKSIENLILLRSKLYQKKEAVCDIIMYNSGIVNLFVGMGITAELERGNRLRNSKRLGIERR